MNEEQVKGLLMQADRAAGAPTFGPLTAARIRRHVHRRHLVRIAAPTAVAAAIVIAATLGTLSLPTPRALPQPERIASLEEQVKQLQTQTETTLKLVQDVLERDRQQRHLASLEAELARIPDPVREIDRQVDKTAFILVYQADKLYKELNQTESAAQAYREVIQLFPTNQWAQVARERLSQIEQRRINKSNGQKGEPKWGPRDT